MSELTDIYRVIRYIESGVGNGAVIDFSVTMPNALTVKVYWIEKDVKVSTKRCWPLLQLENWNSSDRAFLDFEIANIRKQYDKYIDQMNMAKDPK